MLRTLVSLAADFVRGRLCRDTVRLDTAVNNMSQGLLMFDAQGRLVVCNRRYLDMYRLSPDVVKPGCTLRRLIAHRMETGSFSQADPDRYVSDLQAAMAAGQIVEKVIELTDGRIIAVASRPMPTGGWVATHEDITERRLAEMELTAARAQAEQAEHEARATHQRLVDALEVVPEGIALFDADDRYVLWNHRYAQVYAGRHIKLAAGMCFEEVLRAGLAQGIYRDAQGREEEWLAERLARHAEPESSHEQLLAGERWVRVHERRTADGGSIGVRIDITEIKRREDSFRLLFESNPLPMWVYDQETLRFLAVNDAAIAHYGYSRAQFLTMTALDIRPREDHAKFRTVVATRRYDDHAGRTWRHHKADGTELHVAVYSRLLTYDGRPASISAVVDLTERKRAEDEVRQTREFLDAIVENIPVSLVVKNARDHRYVLINRTAEEFFGTPRAHMIGKTAHQVHSPEQARIIAKRDSEVLQSKQPLILENVPIQTIRKGVRLVNSRRLALADREGRPQYLISVLEDVTEQRRAEERIAHMAHHDALTDLPNRAAFKEQLESTFEKAERMEESFAVLCIDLDRFKEVNDIFGHSIGDALLREISRRLHEAAHGAFLARLGGDEFVVIATQEPHPATAEILAERLLATLADDVEIEGRRLRTGLSIGVAIYPTDGSDVATLLSHADAALYRAKADGRNTVRFFEPDMDRRLREQRALQHDLRLALDHHELGLYYQPQLRIGGEIVGFEALVRWHHPQRGMVPPGTFIPLAEESGLIMAIGEWVLREACREAASWSRHLQIAVNLSPVQFRHGDLAGLVHAILYETGLSAERLQLEITEGVLIDDFSRAVAILHRLKAMGVRIAMDDFGTGYSSLSYLQSFPFDLIKIDRAFISNVDSNAQSAAIVRAVIGLARGLNVPVIAEGVETKGELDFLAQEACSEAQGYLIGRPEPIDTYAAVVGRQTIVQTSTRKAS
jgi:diguanylate cyclase (GGDEF)-like protein/PAS domain S-box-containing protein